MWTAGRNLASHRDLLGAFPALLAGAGNGAKARSQDAAALKTVGLRLFADDTHAAHLSFTATVRGLFGGALACVLTGFGRTAARTVGAFRERGRPHRRGGARLGAAGG